MDFNVIFDFRVFMKMIKSPVFKMLIIIGTLLFWGSSCTDENPNDIKTIEGITPVGPYLQNLKQDAVSILWASLNEVGGRVIVRNSSGEEIGQFTDTGIFHSVRIDGLSPNTEYRYQVKESGHTLGAEASFKTPPALDAPEHLFSFAVLGDTGTGSEAQYEVAHQIRLYDPNFIIHTGDIVYPNGAENQYYDKFFRPYQDLITHKVIWPVLGDHDYESDNGKAFDKFFETPANNVEHSKRYYSFEYGNALFIALESRGLVGNTTQHDFLINTLSQSQHTWRFLVIHKPLYSSGEHGSDLNLRDTISPIVEKYNVDFVLSGDDHNYERSNSRQDYGSDGLGTIYIVSGGGGAELRAVGISDFTAFSASIYHFVGFSIHNHWLTLKAIDINGDIVDTLLLDKTPSD